MDKYFNNESLLKVIFKWKWHIVVVTILAAIAGAIFSGPSFITPKYKSEAIVYPNGLSEFSDETYTEQMLQVMESQEIVDSVIKIFDLMKHYGIDPNYKYAKTALMGEYHDRISISKTPYDAVKIKVLDKDPQMACNIANEIIRLYDVKFEIIHKTKKWENVRSFERQLKQKTDFIDSLSNELAKVTDSFKDLETLTKNIRSKLRIILGLDAKVKLESPNTLQRFEGKAKRIRDLRSL